MGMTDLTANEHTFHVFMFYESDTDSFMKQIAFVQRQYEKCCIACCISEKGF